MTELKMKLVFNQNFGHLFGVLWVVSFAEKKMICPQASAMCCNTDTLNFFCNVHSQSLF